MKKTKPKKLGSKFSGWLDKEEALGMSIDINNEILYHGTSENKAKTIDNKGLCVNIDKIHSISDEGIYLTIDKNQAYRWAINTKRKDGSEYGVIYSTKGNDIKELKCKVYPDWNMGFAGKLDSIILIGCPCIPPNKLKKIEADVW